MTLLPYSCSPFGTTSPVHPDKPPDLPALLEPFAVGPQGCHRFRGHGFEFDANCLDRSRLDCGDCGEGSRLILNCCVAGSQESLLLLSCSLMCVALQLLARGKSCS